MGGVVSENERIPVETVDRIAWHPAPSLPVVCDHRESPYLRVQANNFSKFLLDVAIKFAPLHLPPAPDDLCLELLFCDRLSQGCTR